MYHVPMPMNDKLIVLPLPKKEIKIDSLFVPETANAELSEATVVSISPQVKKILEDAQVQLSNGDVVVYPTGAGTGALYKGKPHLWLSASDLWGKEMPEQDKAAK